ncbi:flagellar hook-length control protein FliK [Salinispirillum sp. LH 10-3-1]|uniref:Flagellar hook-length control protein FliK n=1 Tax=Salinispirillum sp. LH 10-3-1 TaxID=2952525 RepID=A0AB38YCV4_9GAMM
MAKIDSIGRMRLPPDSALRPHAYSERERASSEPTRRALTDWFQVIQHQRQGHTDQALVRAIEAAIGPRVDNNQPSPRSLPMTVISSLEATQPGRHEYQVQLGQQVIRISSSTVLQPGQSLLLIPTPKGPQILVPSRPEQQNIMLDAAQRQQLSLLPTLQIQTALTALKALIPDLMRAPAPAAATPQAPNGNMAVPAEVRNAALSASSGLPLNSLSAETGRVTAPPASATSSETQPLTMLRELIGRWAQAMPAAARLAADNPPMPTQSQASPVALPTTATHPMGLLANAIAPSDLAAIKGSQHWVTQLIQVARETYGKATPETVRAVWTQWQQGASGQLQQGNSPKTAGAGSNAGTVNTGTNTSSTQSTDNNPLLRLPVMQGNPKAAHSERPPLPPPADWWRVMAEQLVDQRLLQQGVPAPQLSLQEQLKQRAQDILARSSTLYSPEQMRQSFTARGAGTDGIAHREQQSLLAIRQTLEQVAQQQQVRTVLGLTADPTADTPRLLQGIPVWSDQHLVWFDVERQPSEESTTDGKEQTSEWVLDIHFQLPPMAPVCARMHWRNNTCSLHFLTDDAPTLRAIHSHVSEFSQRLTAMGLPVDDVQCRHGLPKRVSGRTTTHHHSEHQVDIRT